MFLVSRKRTQQKYRVPYVYSVLPPFILYTNTGRTVLALRTRVLSLCQRRLPIRFHARAASTPQTPPPCTASISSHRMWTGTKTPSCSCQHAHHCRQKVSSSARKQTSRLTTAGAILQFTKRASSGCPSIPVRGRARVTRRACGPPALYARAFSVRPRVSAQHLCACLAYGSGTTANEVRALDSALARVRRCALVVLRA